MPYLTVKMIKSEDVAFMYMYTGVVLSRLTL